MRSACARALVHALSVKIAKIVDVIGPGMISRFKFSYSLICAPIDHGLEQLA